MSTRFTQEHVRELADRASVPLTEERAEQLTQRLNECASQFLDIAWTLEHRESNSDLKKKLATIESAATRLRGNLDGDVLDLIKTGVQLKIRKHPICGPPRRGFTIGPAESDEGGALQLLDVVHRGLQAVLDGMDGARDILDGRIAWMKSKHTEHRGDEALDELVWNLLEQWKALGQGKVTHTTRAPADGAVSSETVCFVHDCLQIILRSLSSSQRQDQKLTTLLGSKKNALRERIRRVPERMEYWQKLAEHHRNS